MKRLFSLYLVPIDLGISIEIYLRYFLMVVECKNPRRAMCFPGIFICKAFLYRQLFAYNDFVF